MLAGSEPENTNAFLQLLAQAALASSQRRQTALAGRQQVLHPLQTLSAARAPLPRSPAPGNPTGDPARAASVPEQAPGASLQDLSSPKSTAHGNPENPSRRPESARRGPPAAAGQAHKQARVPKQALPPLVLAEQHQSGVGQADNLGQGAFLGRRDALQLTRAAEELDEVQTHCYLTSNQTPGHSL